MSALALSLTLATAVSTADTVALRSDVPDPVACERPAESMAACTLTAFRLSGADERPVLDGRLDDPVWALATAAVEFRQFEPDPGEPGSERTEARILYDGDALYVGMRMYDSSPDQIRAQFVRRDDHEAVSDWAHVFLDSYHDRRTAFHFATTPTGTRVDILHLEDTEQDVAWDAVWQVETSIDAEGWSAEFRIPLSQLRFGSAEEMTWGVNFMRQIARRSETSHWAQILPESGRLVSLFGDLDGLSGLEAPGRLELLPYSVARLRREDVDDADPFRGDNDVWGSTGLDLKYGVTSNLTLTATVNPDFGQVDADPSVVNLGTRETFYPENRPFFLEGAEIFRFPLVPEGHAFYSRRIGRPPQLGASAPSGGFVDMPETARILGAMKLSGKTSSGWSVGVLHAITSREEAHIAAPDELVTAQAVEPLTNYSVARVVRDFWDGQSGLGAIATATHRDRDDEAFDRLRSSAFVGGLNGWHRFNGSRYQLRGWLLGSHMRGSEDAIARTQRSFVHLHQREDADHLTYDPTRTSLSGIAGEFFFEKIGGGHWTFQLGGGGRGPGIDTNDAGYISYTDVVYGDVRARYREFSPGSIFRNWYVEGEGFLASTLGGEIARPSLHLKTEGQLLNFWTATLNVDHWGSQVWPWELRGGPSLRRPSYTRYQGILSSDSRKSWQAQLRGTYRHDHGADGTVVTLDPLLAVRPSSVHLTLRRGEITGVVGQNAHGKTTLFRMVAGELKHDVGHLSFPTLSKNGDGIDWAQVREGMAYVPQELPKWYGSLLQNIQYEASLHGIRDQENREEVDFIIERMGLQEHLGKSWNQLSGGFKLRFSLARALVWKPKLLLLDEPLGNLDFKAQLVVLKDLKDLAGGLRYPMAVLISSQHLHEVEAVADNLLFLRQGEVVYSGSTRRMGSGSATPISIQPT